MICMSRAKFDRRIYLLNALRKNKVNFSFALWNFNSWNYHFNSFIIVAVLQYLLSTKCEVNWYTCIWQFMHDDYQTSSTNDVWICLQACTPQPAPYCQGCRTPYFRGDNLSQVSNWPPEWSVYNHLYSLVLRYIHVANAQSNTYSIFGNFNIVISM